MRGVDQSKAKLEPTDWCHMIYTEPKKMINNIFSENEWYQTYQNGRNGDFRDNIDCYLRKSSNDIQTAYVCILFMIS